MPTPTLELQDLKSYEQTVDLIKKNIADYWRDLLLYPELLTLSPREFFDFVQGCKYVADPKGIEFVTRPKILLQIIFSGNSFYFDCDDRSGLSGIYFHCRNKILGEKNKIKIVVSGQRNAIKYFANGLFGLPEKVYLPHHVYVIANDLPFDPTYPQNRYGEKLFLEGFYKEYPINI